MIVVDSRFVRWRINNTGFTENIIGPGQTDNILYITTLSLPKAVLNNNKVGQLIYITTLDLPKTVLDNSKVGQFLIQLKISSWSIKIFSGCWDTNVFMLIFISVLITAYCPG